MSNWEEVLGNFKNIQGNTTKNTLGRSVYLNIVHTKDAWLDNTNLDNNPFSTYETIVMATTPKKKDEKNPFTYKGTKITKDPKTNKPVKLENQDLPMKKIVSVTTEAKNGLTILLNMYVRECYEFYKDNKDKFPQDDRVLSKLTEYAETKATEHTVVPAIIRTVDLMDIDKSIETDFAKVRAHLIDKVTPYFKDAEGKTPDTKITIIIDAFVRFLKIVSALMADLIIEKRLSNAPLPVNTALLLGTLRQLNRFLRTNNACFENEVFDLVTQYIEASKPPAREGGKGKKKKSDSDDGDDAGDDAGDEEPDQEEDDTDTADAKPATPEAKPAAKSGKPSAPESSAKSAASTPTKPPAKNAAKAPAADAKASAKAAAKPPAPTAAAAPKGGKGKGAGKNKPNAKTSAKENNKEIDDAVANVDDENYGDFAEGVSLDD